MKAKRRYMHGKRRRRSPFLTGESMKFYKHSKESKLKTGSFVEGSGGKGEHKIIAGGEIGYKGKRGSVSLKPTIISERGKHHSFTKPDIKIGVSTTFQNIKKLFN